jgi:hypothetical protein
MIRRDEILGVQWRRSHEFTRHDPVLVDEHGDVPVIKWSVKTACGHLTQRNEGRDSTSFEAGAPLVLRM